MREAVELLPPGGTDWRRCTNPLLLMQALHSQRPVELWHPDFGNETRFISLRELVILNTEGVWWRVA